MKYFECASTPLVLCLIWEYENSWVQKRLIHYNLAYALGMYGCSYKIQAVDLEFGYIIEEWKHDF